MILNISERKVDNAALVIFHQFVKAFYQVFLGGLFGREYQCLAYQAESWTYWSRALGPHGSSTFDARHFGAESGAKLCQLIKEEIVALAPEQKDMVGSMWAFTQNIFQNARLVLSRKDSTEFRR